MNAIAYMRFSPRPNGQLSESIEMQRDRIVARCTANAWPVLAEYEDRELSGKRADNRPGLQAALAHVCKVKGVLVVYSLSRFSRSLIDAVTLTDQLAKCGASFVSVTEQFDTTTPAGRMFFAMMANLAQFEREQTGQRTSDALRRKQANGERVGRYAPFGFVLDGGDLKPDRAEQRIVKWILDRHALGESPRVIARKLHDGAVAFRTGRWTSRVVARVIRRGI